MFLLLRSSSITESGFCSLFRYSVISLRISNSFGTEEIFFKAKPTELNYFIRVDCSDVQKLSLLKKNKIIHTEIFSVKERTIEVKVENGKFKGSLEIEIIGCDTFTYMENQRRKLEGMEEVNVISYSADSNDVEGADSSIGLHRDSILSGNDYTRREDYLGNLYFSSRRDSLCLYNKSSREDLPRGWEVRNYNGIRYYLDHNNKRVTSSFSYSYNHQTALERKRGDFESFLLFFQFMDTVVNNYHVIYAKRGKLVQSGAETLVKHGKGEKFVVEFLGEIGVDQGGLISEYFYDLSLEICGDPRVTVVDGIFDVKKVSELKTTKRAMEMSNGRSSVDMEEYQDDFDYDTFPEASNANFLEKVFVLLNKEPSLVANVKSLLNSEYSLLSPPKKRLYDFFTEESSKNKNILGDFYFFFFLGCILAHAIIHNIQLAPRFSLSFMENLLGRNFTLEQVQDTQLQKFLVEIKRKKTIDGKALEEILCVEGASADVDTYVQSLVEENLYHSKKGPYDIIRAGFYHLNPIDNLQNFFSATDLSIMLQGLEQITYDLLISCFNYKNCSPLTLEIIFLFSILKEENEPFFREFIKFTTGKPTIPFVSLKTNKLIITLEKTKTESKYFTTSTCIYRIYFGEYRTKEEMKKYLKASIRGAEGFHKA